MCTVRRTIWPLMYMCIHVVGSKPIVHPFILYPTARKHSSLVPIVNMKNIIMKVHYFLLNTLCSVLLAVVEQVGVNTPGL